MSIENNISSVRTRIENACRRAGRTKDDVKLIAVTKTVNADRIMEAISCGIDAIGENKVQEIVDKFPRIGQNVEWHMIGHLQTNKVKYIADKVNMIHSLDSLKLAQEIDKRFEAYGRIIDVLVEINIGREESKHGIDQDELIEFINAVRLYKNINICGLMAVAPAFENPESARPYFRKMKELFDDVKHRNIENVNMKYLSMGMTNDFEVAIEEGSNIVRIGSGIFGPRNY